MEANSFFATKAADFFRGRKFGLALIFVLLLMPQSADAQCAMCRAVLESEGSTSVAEGINNGIVYLMAVPYLLVAGIFFAIYIKMKPKVKNDLDGPVK
ncbi:MAG TPA: hypothetical protein VLZ54_03860 [Arenibacter sp.]|nr:hypothetical protein [Arenibacter sp.]